MSASPLSPQMDPTLLCCGWETSFCCHTYLENCRFCRKCSSLKSVKSISRITWSFALHRGKHEAKRWDKARCWRLNRITCCFQERNRSSQTFSHSWLETQNPSQRLGMLEENWQYNIWSCSCCTFHSMFRISSCVSIAFCSLASEHYTRGLGVQISHWVLTIREREHWWAARIPLRRPDPDRWSVFAHTLLISCN